MRKRLIRNIGRAGEPKPTITDLSPVKEKEVDALTLKNKLGTRYNEKQLAAKPKIPARKIGKYKEVEETGNIIDHA